MLCRVRERQRILRKANLPINPRPGIIISCCSSTDRQLRTKKKPSANVKLIQRGWKRLGIYLIGSLQKKDWCDRKKKVFLFLLFFFLSLLVCFFLDSIGRNISSWWSVNASDVDGDDDDDLRMLWRWWEVKKGGLGWAGFESYGQN